MREPNFFLVGAPKSGTSALAAYLADHPRAFVSVPKEPNFFARHLTIEGRVPPGSPHVSWDAYRSLFGAATDAHLAVGEASTRYLRSERALRAIRETYPSSRIVVMIRNPVDLAISWHGQKLYEGQEEIPDFEEAWRAQPERREGRRRPRGLVAYDALDYERVASVGTQLERLYQVFPESSVCVVLFDDFCADPHQTYQFVLDFLGLPDDGRYDFPVVNAARVLRWPRASQLLRWRPSFARSGLQSLKRRMGVRSLGVSATLDRLMTKRSRPVALSPDFLSELQEVFDPEVRKIETLLGRDLPGWAGGQRSGSKV